MLHGFKEGWIIVTCLEPFSTGRMLDTIKSHIFRKLLVLPYTQKRRLLFSGVGWYEQFKTVNWTIISHMSLHVKSNIEPNKIFENLYWDELSIDGD